MPLFDQECPTCGNVIEVLRRDPPAGEACPTCGDTMHRVFTSPASVRWPCGYPGRPRAAEIMKGADPYGDDSMRGNAARNRTPDMRGPGVSTSSNAFWQKGVIR